MKSVLLVDDKEENLYYLKTLLEGHGYAVAAASNGEEALALAREKPPALVVSDLLMPVMDGYTLLRHWRADPLLQGIPFAVYTATYTDPEDERLARELGADAFILKPAEPEAFLGHIARIREGGSTSRPAARSDREDCDMLKVYSETLVRKLEQKSQELEQANRSLRMELEARQAAEEEQRRLADTQAAILDALPAHIALVDAQGVIVSVNAAWRRFADANVLQRSDYLVGANYLAICESASGDCAAEAVAAAEGIRRVLRAEIDKFELEYPCHSPTESRWFCLVVTPLKEGGAAGAVVMHINITERRKLESQFLRTQRMEGIGTLAGGIAHDLNNILTPILMAVELLKESVGDADGLSLLETLEGNARRGGELVRQVLSFARGVEGKRVAIDPQAIVEDLVRVMRETFPKSITIDFARAAKPWGIVGDPTQLHQVLLNLCVNARDAMPRGGALRISTENVEVDETYASMNIQANAGAYVMIMVEDSGVGIPREFLDKIFEPFFTTKEFGKGTGLGLSTTMAIVRSHGGFITVYSEPGKGTRFKVFLPASSEQASEGLEEGVSRLPWGSGELVLLVDDEDAVRSVARQTLERYGYQVLEAANGAEAIALYVVHRDRVDLVLTDMAMPVMDGPVAIKALRAMSPDLKIIGSSGLTSLGTSPELKDAGVQILVPKPYTAESLLKALDQALHADRD